jgi:hypothetical protein
MLGAAKSRAKKKGLDYSLDKAWLLARLTPMKCELTGLDLRMLDDEHHGRQAPLAPSIDRIDSAKGYTKDNCRVVCWAINCGMSSFGEETYKMIALAYLKSTGLT